MGRFATELHQPFGKIDAFCILNEIQMTEYINKKALKYPHALRPRILKLMRGEQSVLPGPWPV